MKRILVMIAFLCCTLTAGGALAAPVQVNFNSLGGSVIDITTSSLSLDGIEFSYNDLGSGVDFAQVDQNGISGSTFGNLVFAFAAPATTLDFNFFLSGGQSLPNALFVEFLLGSNSVTSGQFPTNANGDGLLAFSGPGFDRVSMFFDFDEATSFQLYNLSYEPAGTTATVPEPATLLLLAFGLLGLGTRRFMDR